MVLPDTGGRCRSRRAGCGPGHDSAHVPSRRASVPRDHSANASVPRHGQPNVARFQVQVALREGDLDPVLVELTPGSPSAFPVRPPARQGVRPAGDRHWAFRSRGTATIASHFSRFTCLRPRTPALPAAGLRRKKTSWHATPSGRSMRATKRTAFSTACVRDAVWDAVDRCVNARCAKFLKW